MTDQAHREIEASFDAVAEPFAAEFFDELAHKPFDCEVLDQFADTLRGRGLVCEIGCGPGQVARYLQDRGVRMCGFDLSEGMVRVARLLNPDISFERGDMVSLDKPADTFAGIISFYAIIHLRREEVQPALEGMYRVLMPGGRLLFSFHGGEGEIRRDKWYDKAVSIYITLFELDEMKEYLERAGFIVERIVEREAYSFERTKRRLYASARKPDSEDSNSQT